MSLNIVRLPAYVIAELYPDSLVLTGDEPGIKKTLKITPAGEAADYSNKSLGDNLKNILIVVNNPGIPHLPDEELRFLTGILAACKLSLADVAIINRSNFPLVSYKELTGVYKSKIVLLFDVSPAEFGLPMNFPLYQLQAFAGNTFLYAPSLKNLENDKVEKSKLWVLLKRLFNL